MEHLKSEYAMENLLFVTILLQWEDYLIQNGFYDEMVNIANNEQFKLRYLVLSNKRVELPLNVPLSPIIGQLNNINYLKKNKKFEFIHNRSKSSFNLKTEIKIISDETENNSNDSVITGRTRTQSAGKYVYGFIYVCCLLFVVVLINIYI